MKKMVQFFKSKRLYRYSFIAAAVLVSAAVVYAAAVPYTFTSGTVAKSSEVNANFTYLADRAWEKSGSDLYYSNGNVGIGAISPTYKLNVNGYFAATDLVSITSSGSPTEGGELRLYDAGATSGLYVIDNYGAIDTSRVMRIFYAPPGKGIFMATNGNIGMNADPSLHPLQMGSGAYVTTGGVWTNASSRTFKEHIAELTSNEAIAAFQGLKPVTYNYKVDKDEKHVGFIAEDVPTILATKDRKGVSPMDVVALLTKVVQEQQKTIAVLVKEVEGLKKGRM